MKPTALVVEWKDWDLPRWSDAGFYRNGGYHAQKIRDGETMQPNDGNMWESPYFSRPRGPAAEIDPTLMEPIDLAPPSPTPAQAEAAKLLEVINAIKEAVQFPEGVRIEDYAAEYRRQIAEAERIISEMELDEDAVPGPRPV